MCQTYSGPAQMRKRRHITKNDLSPEERRAFESMLAQYRDALQPIESEIKGWVSGADPDDLTSLATIREQMNLLVDGRVGEFEAVFREGGREGAQAGRAVAARQHQLAVNFNIVPERTLAQLDDWVDTAASSTLETITEDATHWLRGAHEDGLSIPDIADQLNDELFEGRLEGYVAERAARTGTISTSNAGSHSAFEDADSVIGEEWLATNDARTREDHTDADGQVVPVDESFEVGGVYMSHPGDPGAAIGQIANCRCTIAPVFADDLTEEQLEAVLDGGRIWIR